MYIDHDFTKLSDFFQGTSILENESNFNNTGELENVNSVEENYGDSSLDDLRELQQLLSYSSKIEAFSSVPSSQFQDEETKILLDNEDTSLEEIEINTCINKVDSNSLDDKNFLLFEDSANDKDNTVSINDNLQPNLVSDAVEQYKVKDDLNKYLKGDNLIQFQQTLNKTLESLLHMMKNTEYSRYALAKYSRGSFIFSQNSIDSSGPPSHNTTKSKIGESTKPSLPPLGMLNHNFSPIVAKDTKFSLCKKRRQSQNLSKMNFDTKNTKLRQARNAKKSKSALICKKRHQNSKFVANVLTC